MNPALGGHWTPGEVPGWGILRALFPEAVVDMGKQTMLVYQGSRTRDLAPCVGETPDLLSLLGGGDGEWGAGDSQV